MFQNKYILGFFAILFTFIVGGMGGAFMTNSVIPRVISWPWVAELDLFENVAERTTVIEKTEEVTVREDDSVETSIAQPSTTTVTIIFPKRVTGNTTEEEMVVPGVLVTNDGVMVTYREDGNILPTPRVAILNNGDKHEVDFLGYDSFTNLLFYKIKKSTNTPTIAFANSDDTRTGKKILLLKNGLTPNESAIDFAVMAGREHIVNLAGATATSEKWEGVFGVTSGVTVRFIGAPVISYNNEMVGIVGSVTLTEGVQKLFVLPANVVRTSLEKVSKQELTKQATLGVEYISLTPQNQNDSSLALTKGALVTKLLSRATEVSDRYTAKKIKIKEGDVIVKIDDTEVTPTIPLSTLIYNKEKGEETRITILREGKEEVLTTNFE
jgi:serine protease Do